MIPTSQLAGWEIKLGARQTELVNVAGGIYKRKIGQSSWECNYAYRNALNRWYATLCVLLLFFRIRFMRTLNILTSCHDDDTQLGSRRKSRSFHKLNYKNLLLLLFRIIIHNRRKLQLHSSKLTPASCKTLVNIEFEPFTAISCVVTQKKTEIH